MASKPVTLRNTRAPVDFNLLVESPHAVAYRLWKQEPGQRGWTKLDEGTSTDEESDHKSLGILPEGTTVLYWLAAGGHANTPYRLVVTFGQGGSILSDGVCPEAGSVSPQGSDVVKRKVLLRA